jgi:hypothetical protein
MRAEARMALLCFAGCVLMALLAAHGCGRAQARDVPSLSRELAALDTIGARLVRNRLDESFYRVVQMHQGFGRRE